ncbi:hypothetical protein GE21DRAFT_1018224 [Neurospora crassa]|nr:hypothetical protein GE21DRAFT_1018224 [Neurospora crassa]
MDDGRMHAWRIIMLEFCMIQLFSLFSPLVYRKATVVSRCWHPLSSSRLCQSLRTVRFLTWPTIYLVS